MSVNEPHQDDPWSECSSRIATLGLPLARLEAKAWTGLLPPARRRDILLARKLADSLNGLELWIEFVEEIDPISLDYISEDVENHALRLLARVGQLLGSVNQIGLDIQSPAATQAGKDVTQFLDEHIYDFADEFSESSSDSDPSDTESDDEILVGNVTLTGLSASLSTAVSCLSQIKSAIETSCRSGNAEQHEAGSVIKLSSEQGQAFYFTRLILARFNEIDLALAERLGEVSWQRWKRLQSLSKPATTSRPVNSVVPQYQQELSRRRVSTSAGPNTASYLPTPASYLPTPRASGAPIAKAKPLVSNGVSSINVSFELPPVPLEIRVGEPFECLLCGKRIVNARTERQWREHLYEDLKPYVCCRASCNEGHVAFASTMEWIKHDIVSHLSEHSSEQSQPQTCPICKDYESADLLYYSSHVAGHLEMISLSALPQRTEAKDVPVDDSRASAVSRSSPAIIHEYPAKAPRPSAQSFLTPPRNSRILSPDWDTEPEENESTDQGNKPLEKAPSKSFGETSAAYGLGQTAAVAAMAGKAISDDWQSTSTKGKAVSPVDKLATPHRVPWFKKAASDPQKLTHMLIPRSRACKECILRNTICSVSNGQTRCAMCTARKMRCQWLLHGPELYISTADLRICRATTATDELKKILARSAQEFLFRFVSNGCFSPTESNDDLGVWICPMPFCEKKCSSKSQWRDHIESKDLRSLWGCPDHPEQFFDTEAGLKRHVEDEAHSMSTDLILKLWPALLCYNGDGFLKTLKTCLLCYKEFPRYDTLYQQHAPTHTSAYVAHSKDQQSRHKSNNGSSRLQQPVTSDRTMRLLLDQYGIYQKTASKLPDEPQENRIARVKEEPQDENDEKTQFPNTSTDHSPSWYPSVSEASTSFVSGSQSPGHVPGRTTASHPERSRVVDYLTQRRVGSCPRDVQNRRGPLYCLNSDCTSLFFDQTTWLGHIQDLDPEKLWFCPFDGRIHHREENFLRHRRGHISPAPQEQCVVEIPKQERQCPVCKFRTADWDVFYRTHLADCMRRESESGNARSLSSPPRSEGGKTLRWVIMSELASPAPAPASAPSPALYDKTNSLHRTSSYDGIGEWGGTLDKGKAASEGNERLDDAETQN